MGSGESGMTRADVESIRRQYNLSPEYLRQVMESFRSQADQHGLISREGFVNSILDETMCRESAEKTFEIFDRDHSGFMDIKEYLTMVAITQAGTLDQRLEASFQLFDRDYDGLVSKDEVKHVFSVFIKEQRAGASVASGKSADDLELTPADLKQIDQVTSIIFDKCDTNQDGFLSKEEFFRGFKRHPTICQFFEQF
ncbi:hypothetical protein Pelo_12163 [Pelomyxa schiedti]|nr:hypothetical protein Pelo_12163 [Pelomyxa schiedti]